MLHHHRRGSSSPHKSLGLSPSSPLLLSLLPPRSDEIGEKSSSTRRTTTTRAQYHPRNDSTATLPKTACSDPTSDLSPNRTPDTHKASKPGFRAHDTRTPQTLEEAQGKSKGSAADTDLCLRLRPPILTREQTVGEHGPTEIPKDPRLCGSSSWLEPRHCGTCFLDNCSEENISDLLRTSRRSVYPLKSPSDATRLRVRDRT